VLQFNMPIEVNWDVMDTQLLQRFWSGHPRLRHGTADLLERVMVFHRGIHTVSLREHYTRNEHRFMPPLTNCMSANSEHFLSC